ncbi:MAG: dTDP-4-dehydrorhamnose reductase [Parvularculaceae bacterium]
MRILLFGSNGQVGREVQAAAKDCDLIALTRVEADLSVDGMAAAAIECLAPDAIINAAAYTAVDKAEADREAARRLNAEAPAEIARAASRIGARLIHLSTDYVFSGDSPAPLDETAPTGPVNYYGETKLEGEMLVAEQAPGGVIVRTSWVFAPHGSNFVGAMMRLSQTQESLRIVSDQTGGPTPAAAIAAAVLKIATARNGPAGLYHFQGAPSASWAEFAEAIFKAAGCNTRVEKIATANYKTPAKRPLTTILNCEKILRDYGVAQPDWRIGLRETALALKNG